MVLDFSKIEFQLFRVSHRVLEPLSRLRYSGFGTAILLVSPMFNAIIEEMDANEQGYGPLVVGGPKAGHAGRSNKAVSKA